MDVADADEAGATLRARMAARGRDPLVGLLIDGRYRLVRRLGAGGMGVVYEGRHEVTGREVAIKVLHPNASHSDEVLARFAREARTGAAIGHPNIVDVLDAGKLPEGTPFLVMELLHGEALGDALGRETRFTPERTAEIIADAAAALAALHAHGVIHRDVKTDNLFIERCGRVKLLDFGLAVFTEGPVSGRLTREGQVNGTPQYMPPEVFDGTAPTVSWDVYALATVAFELLTGVVPFEGTNPMVTLFSKRESVAPRLGDCVDAHFSEQLERVIGRGLERDPGRRHETPVAFAEELSRAASLLVAHEAPSPAPAAVLATPPRAHSEPAITDSSEVTIGNLVSGRRRSRAALLTGACVAVLCFTLMAFARSGPAAPRFTLGTPRVTAVSAPVRAEAAAASVVLPPAAPVAPEAEVVTSAPTESPAEPPPPSRSGSRHHRSRAHAAALAATAPSGDARIVPASARAPSRSDETNGRELARAGTSALMRGRIPDAIDLLHRATLAAPGSSPAWRSLGLANERMGRRSEARRAYARYLELAPNAGDADEVRRRVESL